MEKNVACSFNCVLHGTSHTFWHVLCLISLSHASPGPPSDGQCPSGTKEMLLKSQKKSYLRSFSPARMHHGKDALYCLLLSHIIKVICQYSESMTERTGNVILCQFALCNCESWLAGKSLNLNGSPVPLSAWMRSKRVKKDTHIIFFHASVNHVWILA